MKQFPATFELIGFVLCLIVLIFCIHAIVFAERWVGWFSGEVFQRVSSKLRFPRALLDPKVKALRPLHKFTIKRLVYRFKFTLCILFLNAFIFLFTNDLISGVLDPEVLENRGFSYAQFSNHKWFILVTSNFIHFHWLHLIVNMSMLILFSGSVELLMGTRFVALVYLFAMNSNVPNGLFLLPLLKILHPELWQETVHYVDVGASLGIIGCLGGLARLLKFWPRFTLLSVAVLGALAGSIYIHNLFGIDHAFSAIIGFIVASYLLKQKPMAAKVFFMNPVSSPSQIREKHTGTHF